MFKRVKLLFFLEWSHVVAERSSTGLLQKILARLHLSSKTPALFFIRFSNAVLSWSVDITVEPRVHAQPRFCLLSCAWPTQEVWRLASFDIFSEAFTVTKYAPLSLYFPVLNWVTRSCGYAWLGAITLSASREPRAYSALFNFDAFGLFSSIIYLVLSVSSSWHGSIQEAKTRKLCAHYTRPSSECSRSNYRHSHDHKRFRTSRARERSLRSTLWFVKTITGMILILYNFKAFRKIKVAADVSGERRRSLWDCKAMSACCSRYQEGNRKRQAQDGWAPFRRDRRVTRVSHFQSCVYSALANKCRFVEGMCEEVKNRLDRGTIRRALGVYSDSKRIKGLKETLRDFLQDFQVQQLLHAI